jgi:uncharacterized membrane protein
MKLLLPLIITLVILLAPDLAWAADITDKGVYTGGGFIPCGQNADNPCNSCHIIVLANTLIKWLIGMAFLFFAVLAVFAGFKLVTSAGNAHAKEEAKGMFTNAFIGLFIILGAWLFVDTLLRGILKGGTGEIAGYGPWAQVKCVKEVKPGVTEMTIDEASFEPWLMVTATGDNKSTFSPATISQRVAAIRASASVTQMSDAALDRLGITDPAQRKAFRALISQESSNCKIKVGPDTGAGRGSAYGCTQILVSTARELDASASKKFVGKSDAQVAAILQSDNAYAIQLGAQYYKQGLQKYGSITAALARYNGGDTALKASATCPGQLFYQCEINTRYAQTRNYVANINAVAAQL